MPCFVERVRHMCMTRYYEDRAMLGESRGNSRGFNGLDWAPSGD